MKKKLLSLLLAVSMILPALPVQAAEKIGDMTIDKVRYYDVGSESFDDGVPLFAKELLAADYGGSTESKVDMASWWQRLGFSIMKQHGRGTSTSKFRDQMNAVMLNAMGYKIGAEKSYNKSHTNDDNTYQVYASGLKNAASIKSAASEMEKQVYQYYSGASGSRDKEDAVASNGDLSKLSSSQPAYWMVAGAFKTSGNNKKGHYQALGVVFSDFKISTILPEDKGDGEFYIVDEGSSTSTDVIATDVKNLSLEPIEATQSVTDTKTITATSEISGSEEYGFEESISVSYSTEVGTPLMSSTLSVEAGFTASQAIQKGWSDSKSEAKEDSFTSSVKVELPAHTQVMITQKKDTSEVVTTYDCPVVLSFSVRIVEYTLDPSDNDADAKTKTLATFDKNARKQILQRGIVEKNLTDTVNGINWKNLHTNNGWIIDILAYNAPMSSAGAKFTVVQNTVDSEVFMLPIYSLTDIKVADGTKVIQLNTGESVALDDIELTGLNREGVPYYGFNEKNGHWILVDGNGKEITTTKIASITTDKLDGSVSLEAGTRTGTVYLKYVIDEDCYTNSSAVDNYTTNAQLHSTAVIKINVIGETPFVIDDRSSNNLDTELPETAEYVAGENGEDTAIKGYFQVNDPEKLLNEAMTSGNPFTVSSRVYVPASVKSANTGVYEEYRKHNIIASLGDDSFGYRAFYNSNSEAFSIQAYIGNGSEWDQIIVEDIEEDFFDNWHTIAVAYTGTELKLYIDGEVAAVSEGPITDRIFDGGYAFSVGYDPQKENRKSELTFEQVVVYNEALTAEETVTEHRSDAENVILFMDCSKFGEAEYVEPTPPVIEMTFEDVKEDDYFYNAVLWAVQKGITNGVSPTQFKPYDGCTRGQIVTFIWRAEGQPAATSTECTFKDVEAGQFYYDPMLWGVETGVITGYSADRFAPDDICTRGQIVTMLWRAKGKPEVTNKEHSFTDVKEGEYYYDPMLWAVENEITKGQTATTFAPDKNVTRAETVTFLSRTYK